jgi:6-phosphofructokinase 1
MVAARGDGIEPVPLQDVAGKLKTIPLDHPWLETLKRVSSGRLGD